MRRPSPEAHWRDSARPAKFFVIDARAAFPVFFCLLHIRLWTIIFTIVVTLFFALLYRYGFTLSIFGRWLRSVLGGKRKMAIPWWM